MRVPLEGGWFLFLSLRVSLSGTGRPFAPPFGVGAVGAFFWTPSGVFPVASGVGESLSTIVENIFSISPLMVEEREENLASTSLSIAPMSRSFLGGGPCAAFSSLLSRKTFFAPLFLGDGPRMDSLSLSGIIVLTSLIAGLIAGGHSDLEGRTQRG